MPDSAVRCHCLCTPHVQAGGLRKGHKSCMVLHARVTFNCGLSAEQGSRRLHESSINLWSVSDFEETSQSCQCSISIAMLCLQIHAGAGKGSNAMVRALRQQLLPADPKERFQVRMHGAVSSTHAVSGFYFMWGIWLFFQAGCTSITVSHHGIATLPMRSNRHMSMQCPSQLLNDAQTLFSIKPEWEAEELQPYVDSLKASAPLHLWEDMCAHV